MSCARATDRMFYKTVRPMNCDGQTVPCGIRDLFCYLFLHEGKEGLDLLGNGSTVFVAEFQHVRGPGRSGNLHAHRRLAEDTGADGLEQVSKLGIQVSRPAQTWTPPPKSRFCHARGQCAWFAHPDCLANTL